MSKIGKKPINIPENVKVEINGSLVKIWGPLGNLEFEYPSHIFKIEKENNILKIIPLQEIDKKTKPLWGTIRSILNNKILGVSQGFKKTLILQGLGYNAEIKGNKIVFRLGFSHLVEVEVPQGIEIELKQEKGRVIIIIKGIDKEKVGNFAAKIKSLKPADRYHLKGFMYEGEFIPTKQVKKLGK